MPYPVWKCLPYGSLQALYELQNNQPFVCTMAEFISFVMNNKAFGNLFCNSQKDFSHLSGIFLLE